MCVLLGLGEGLAEAERPIVLVGGLLRDVDADAVPVLLGGGERVGLAEAVDVLEGEDDLEPVGDTDADLLSELLPVIVPVARMVLVIAAVALPVFVPGMDFVIRGDAVEDLERVAVRVLVVLTNAEIV